MQDKSNCLFLKTRMSKKVFYFLTFLRRISFLPGFTNDRILSIALSLLLKFWVMKKRLLFLIMTSCFLSVTYGQAYESTIEYNKKKQNAYAIEYPYPAEALENAIVSKIEKMGYKGKEEKGL